MNMISTKNRSRSALRASLAVLAALATLGISTSGSFALGTAQQQAACTSDVMRLCLSAAFSGDKAIVDCMKQNYDGLSERCKRTLPPL